jgi:putative AlgH/UPF0301 family transcriptional regulator
MLAPIVHRSCLVLSASLLVAASMADVCRECGPPASAYPVGERVVTPSFTGLLLTATATMPDSDFAGTRILMLEHDEHGAVGVVINRPTGSLGDAITVYNGGPLQTIRPFLLHDASYALASTRVLFGDVALTSGADVRLLSDALSGHGPGQVWVIDGYAGWGPGQLERELALGVWRLEERGDLWR